MENFSQNGDNVQTKNVAKPDHIFMDAVAFGFTCCCLQTTVQASNIQEAFIIYDNLAPLCPIMVSIFLVHFYLLSILGAFYMVLI